MAVLDIFDSYFNLTIARNITFREIVLAIVAVYTISIVVQGIRRVWFHPLSKYPGPRLAALTLWWQCYYDVFLNGGGQLLAQLKPLHEKYGMWSVYFIRLAVFVTFEIGPVVRIGPNHVGLFALCEQFKAHNLLYSCISANRARIMIFTVRVRRSTKIQTSTSSSSSMSPPLARLTDV